MLEELGSCGTTNLRRLVRLQSCVSEALRLSSGSLTLRQARRPTTLTLDSSKPSPFVRATAYVYIPMSAIMTPSCSRSPGAIAGIVSSERVGRASSFAAGVASRWR